VGSPGDAPDRAQPASHLARAVPSASRLPVLLLRTHIIANYSNPAYGCHKKYILNFFPSPYNLVDYLAVILSWVFPLQFSWKLILSLYIILLPWSIFYLIRSVDKRKTILGFFSFLFIYSWYFNKGFVNFVFSLPFFFFTLGFWWQSQNRLTWKRQALLCVLILCVYLSHLITYMILLFTFAILMIVAVRDFQKGVRTALPFLPSLLLLAGAFTYYSPTYAGGNGPLVLLYGSLERKLELAFSPFSPYFTSFSPAREGKILLAAGMVALPLFIATIRTLGRNYFFILLCMLMILYISLPEDISQLNYVANRVVILLPLMGLLLLSTPTTALFQAIFLLLIVSLSTLHLGSTLLDYYSANQGLHDYYAAMQQIPARKRVYFRTAPQLYYIGHITPFAMFDAYYYLENGGGAMPGGLVDFIGPLRPVQFKHPIPRPVDDRTFYPSILARVQRGGYAAVIRAEEAELANAASKYGLKPVFTAGSLALYRKERTSTLKPPPWPPRDETEPLHTYDYLLLYQDASRIDPMILRKFEHIFSAGFAHVFKNREN
jgi:hypothetical protein